MFPLLETIKIRNNTFCNIFYHNERVNYTRRRLFNLNDIWQIPDLIKITGTDYNQTFKCRFLYGHNPGIVEIFPYILPNIKKLRMIENNEINYSFKFSNRSDFDKMKTLSDGADDVLIIKNGFVADTSFANIVFFDGQKWVTPSSPLLKGTKRQFYIDRGLISEAIITPENIGIYEKARIINAMIDLEESADIEICNIL